jgi:hypothetical protein
VSVTGTPTNCVFYVVKGVLLLTAPAALAACGYVEASVQDVQDALRQAEEAEKEAKQEALAWWLLLECETCYLQQFYLGESCAGSAAPNYRDICQQAGCNPKGDLRSCQAYTQACREQNL